MITRTISTQDSEWYDRVVVSDPPPQIVVTLAVSDLIGNPDYRVTADRERRIDAQQPHRRPKPSGNKYMPHQGKRECARRWQMARDAR